MAIRRARGGKTVHVLAAEQDLSLGRLLEARDHPQQSGLAASRRSEEDEELALLGAEVDTVDGVDVAEAAWRDRGSLRPPRLTTPRRWSHPLPTRPRPRQSSKMALICVSASVHACCGVLSPCAASANITGMIDSPKIWPIAGLAGPG